MRLSLELIIAAVGTAAFVIGLLFLRGKATRTRNVGRPVTSGPASLRYNCAGCAQKFTHSRRTLADWKRGTRRFYCNACHTKRRLSRS